MSTHIQSQPDTRLHALQQGLKWTIYTLLIVNFVFYFFEDFNRTLHVITPDSGLFKWTREFAQSIDLAAWLILLFMFELETYILEDESWKGWVSRSVRGLRVICFLMIAHTVVAYSNSVIELSPTVPVAGAATLCDVVDEDVSFVFNLEYTDVTDENCAQLSPAAQFFRVGNDPVVSSFEGLQLERYLAWVDLTEVIIWLVVILLIEITIRAQDRGVTGGRFITTVKRVKLGLYASLMAMGVYWLTLGHWLYFWDELLWVAGFSAIEVNLSEWRDELKEEAA